MALNLCKATESHWKRNCASLSSVETEVILWPRSFKELHSRFVDWAQSFQSNRLEHVRPWQCGVPAVFVWLRIAIIDYYYHHHRHHHHSTTSTITQLPPPRRLYAVMWSETVGLRTRPVWDQKKSVLVFGLARCGLGLGLAGLVFCCETRSCHARRHKWSWRTQQLFKYYYFIVSTLCLEHHYCGDQQWLSLT